MTKLFEELRRGQQHLVDFTNGIVRRGRTVHTDMLVSVVRFRFVTYSYTCTYGAQLRFVGLSLIRIEARSRNRVVAKSEPAALSKEGAGIY